MNPSHLFRIELLLTSMLTGLIWTIQLVHYPAFRYIDPAKLKGFFLFHQNRISFIVVPLMIAELLLAAYLVYLGNPGSELRFTLTGLIWLSTFTLSVPLHQTLLQNSTPAIIDRLILTNWPRTILWSLKTGLILYFYNT